MPRLSCDEARELLAEAVKEHKSIPSLAQCILSLCPEGTEYSDFIDEALGPNWPDCVRRANAAIRKSTGIRIQRKRPTSNTENKNVP